MLKAQFSSSVSGDLNAFSGGILLRLGDGGARAWWGDLLSVRFRGSQFEIEVEVNRQRVFAFLHVVGGADDGVEGGMSVAEAVGAGNLEGAIEVAQSTGGIQ